MLTNIYYSITVGASDSGDDFAYFSNYGTCVNIIAPVYIIMSDMLLYMNRVFILHQPGSIMV